MPKSQFEKFASKEDGGGDFMTSTAFQSNKSASQRAKLLNYSKLVTRPGALQPKYTRLANSALRKAERVKTTARQIIEANRAAVNYTKQLADVISNSRRNEASRGPWKSISDRYGGLGTKYGTALKHESWKKKAGANTALFQTGRTAWNEGLKKDPKSGLYMKPDGTLIQKAVKKKYVKKAGPIPNTPGAMSRDELAKAFAATNSMMLAKSK